MSDSPRRRPDPGVLIEVAATLAAFSTGPGQSWVVSVFVDSIITGTGLSRGVLADRIGPRAVLVGNLGVLSVAVGSGLALLVALGVGCGTMVALARLPDTR